MIDKIAQNGVFGWPCCWLARSLSLSVRSFESGMNTVQNCGSGDLRRLIIITREREARSA